MMSIALERLRGGMHHSVTFAICSQGEARHNGSWWEVSATTVEKAEGTAWLQCRGAIVVSRDSHHCLVSAAERNCDSNLAFVCAGKLC